MPAEVTIKTLALTTTAVAAAMGVSLAAVATTGSARGAGPQLAHAAYQGNSSFLLGLKKQLTGGHAQGLGDALQVVERNVCLASFDGAHVRAVKFAPIRKRLL
jgi:hypothetical protein